MGRSFQTNPVYRLVRWMIRASYQNREFLRLTDGVEGLISRALSVATIAVIVVATIDLMLLLSRQLLSSPVGFFNSALQDIFGSLLSVLIALEILENVTAYLRRHVVQVELVMATSLTAVARKFIILDLDKVDGIEILGLGFAILALAGSYWLIRNANRNHPSSHHHHDEPPKAPDPADASLDRH